MADALLIARSNFKLKELPIYHPESNSYYEFWREQKKRCIEGRWVSGRWIPGKLYFYINFGVIKLNKKGSKVKSYGQPYFRDLEEEFFYNWTEARGFSGFTDDPVYTSLRAVQDLEMSDQFIKDTYCTKELPGGIFVVDEVALRSVFHADGTRKEYRPARECLRTTHPTSLGRPLYLNDAKDLMMMGSRGYGKSYSVGVGIIAHEWLFNGQTHYTQESIDHPTSSEVVAGAGDAKYSSETLSKTRIALDKLPGRIEMGNRIYPSPLSKKYTGSWMPASEIVQRYREKMSGNWEWKGSMSTIKHRTFKDNPFAANGTRPGVLLMEEVGMFDNLRECRAPLVECMRDGGRKFGSCMYIGTGGDMNGGGTVDSSMMFYEPAKYDLIEFDDVWEHRGKIAYFIPAYLGLNEFKNQNGDSDTEGAKKFLKKERDKLRTSKSGSDALDGELQNRPVVPSEIFLAKTGNIFPIADLQNRLRDMESYERWSMLEHVCELYYDSKAALGGVSYKIDTKNKLKPINRFPFPEKQRDGALVIYEFPQTINGEVPHGAYVIGHDPYASDDPSGGSLGSIYVIKTSKYFDKIGHNEIVAQFVGRPYEGRHIINDILLKLSLFYNAKVYFENVRGNVKEYFEKNKYLSKLAKQPTTIFNKKAVYATNAPLIYGYPMSSRAMKQEMIHYIRDWLMEIRGVDDDANVIRNLDRIWDRALLQELIAFNWDGNFDRVMGLGGAIIGLQEMTNKQEIYMSNKDKKDPLEFLVHNKNLFKAQHIIDQLPPINFNS